jgi:hypothetical protein
VDTQDWVYVPHAARAAVLEELHAGHPGAATRQHRAKAWFLWQHMRMDVIQYAEQCEVCALHRPRQAREPLQPRSMPSAPGDIVAADFFQLKKKIYLVLYDVFCQFPFLWPVQSASATAVINVCCAFFQFSGCPQAFYSDQGGAFDSHEF